MEIVAIAVIVFSSWWGITSSYEEEPVAVEQVAEVQPVEVEAESNEYVRANGYFIKDLTVRHETPHGCHKPVLTTDLSAPAQDGVRTVTEVNASCEG